jgi:TolB-like protein
MIRFKRYLLAGIVFFVFVNGLNAENGINYNEDSRGPGSTGAKFLLFSPSAKASAMGDVFITLDSPEIISANPAGLILLLKNKEAGLMHARLFQDNELNFITGAVPAGKKMVLGAGILLFSTPEDPVYDWSGNETGENIKYRGRAFGFGGAYRVSERISLGINLKSVSEKLIDDQQDAFAFDMGGIYEYPMQSGDLKFGASASNLGSALREGQGLPDIYRLSAAYKKDKLTLGAEFSSIGQEEIRNFNLGAEYWLTRGFAARAGVKTAADEENICLGFGVKWERYRLDYAFLPNQALGATHRIGLGAKFGEITAEPERKIQKKEAPADKPAPVKIKPGEAINIAVAELSGKNVSAMDAAIVSDFIRTELVRTRAFKVLDRQNMERILEEQSFQMTGCTTEECAVRMGKVLNVRYMIVGTFSKFLETYYINVNVVSVETGEIVVAEAVECESGKELPSASKKIAESIAQQFEQ